MTKRPEVVADDEAPGPEPDGFWAGIHVEVAELSKLGADGDNTPSRS